MYRDLTGMKFNRLTVIKRSDREGNKTIHWDCKCECGKEVNVRCGALKRGDVKSCGCIRALDIKGKRFGMLTVLERDFSKHNKQGQAQWKCKCDCGKFSITTTLRLTCGMTKSCGCLKYRTGGHHPAFCGYEDIDGNYWNRMKNGAKTRSIKMGVSIKNVWDLFVSQNGICALSGEKLIIKKNGRTASLDRIDSSKGYVKGNIQWVHKDINMMKHSFSTTKFIELCESVVKYKNKKYLLERK